MDKWADAYRRLELAYIDIEAALLLEFAEYFYAMASAEWEGSTWRDFVRFEIAEELARRATALGPTDPQHALCTGRKQSRFLRSHEVLAVTQERTRVRPHWIHSAVGFE